MSLDQYNDEEIEMEFLRRAHSAGLEEWSPAAALAVYEAEILGRSRVGALNDEERAALGALGLTGEAGEVADIVKKHLFHGATLNRDALVKELGDVLWYLTVLARCTAGVSLGEVALANIRKLRLRHPHGFTPETAAAKVDEVTS